MPHSTLGLAEALDFVRAHTAPAPVPLVPEIVLYQATHLTPLWNATTAQLASSDPAPFVHTDRLRRVFELIVVVDQRIGATKGTLTTSTSIREIRMPPISATRVRRRRR